MSSNVKSVVAIAAGLSLFSISSYLLYLVLKKDRDDDEDFYPTPFYSKHKREVKIPKEHVRTVIGRNGSNLREIEKRSQTKISFLDTEKDGCRICIVKGKKKNCVIAESLINDMIMNQPVIETKEFVVPAQTTPKIIGLCGERMHHITMTSGAKIEILNVEDSDGMEKKISIKGTVDQIKIAYDYIMDIVNEDVEARKKMEDMLAKREPRVKLKSNNSKKEEVSFKKSWEKLTNSPTGHDGHMEVYVSAAVNPSQFWLQIVGPNANELDQLVEEMTDYYSKFDNQELHKLPNPTVGEIVAAVFNFDEKWYRAEIVAIRQEENEQIAQLFYVDYGDSDDVPISKVFELRTDFLRLRFQAIECYLARIKPKDGTWTMDAVDCFDELTHLAQWKKLRARVNGYRDRDSSPYGRAKREGSPIPGVDLYDVSNEDDIDVAFELVRNGFAVFEETVNGTSDDENISEMRCCDSVTNGDEDVATTSTKKKKKSTK